MWLIQKLIFWFGVGLLIFGLMMAMFGYDTPQQIRGIAEMIVGYKLVER